MFVIIQTTYSARFAIAIVCWKKTLISALKQTNKTGVGYHLELFWLFLFLCLGSFLLWKKKPNVLEPVIWFWKTWLGK